MCFLEFENILSTVDHSVSSAFISVNRAEMCWYMPMLRVKYKISSELNSQRRPDSPAVMLACENIYSIYMYIWPLSYYSAALDSPSCATRFGVVFQGQRYIQFSTVEVEPAALSVATAPCSKPAGGEDHARL